MVRRALLAAILIAGTAASGWAGESATFVLTDGQRFGGTLIYGRGDNNIVDLQFHLSVSGNDRAFPMDQVAAIDFTGANPSTSELDSLPTDGRTGVMVMRDGGKVRGHLHNIIASGHVQWVNEAGVRQNWAIRDVSRLYLNPPSAHLAYDSMLRRDQERGQGQGQGQGRAQGRGQEQDRGRGQGRGQDRGQVFGGPDDQNTGAIRLDGNQPWVDTGVRVREGRRLVFVATGRITLADRVSSGPAGTRAVRCSRCPVRNAPAGALIGRVDDGEPFLIGAFTEPMAMPASGRLFLGINDDYFDDNGGAFRVTMSWQ
ncbi:MAG TPA: hypothetical protein VGK32_07365 [Vicinamibacterales bacterium]